MNSQSTRRKTIFENDLLMQGLFFLRIFLLALLYLCAFITFKKGGLALIISVVLYFFYCLFWNFWGWAGIGHELTHGSVFKYKKANSRWLFAVCLLALQNKSLFQSTHFWHHRAPHTESDFESPSTSKNVKSSCPAVWLVLLIDFPKLTNTIKYIIFNSAGFIPVEKLRAFLLRSDRRYEGVVFDARVMLSYLSCVLALSIAVGDITPVMIFLAPNFIATGAAKGLSALQHPTKELLQSVGINKVKFKGSLADVAQLDDQVIRDGLDLILPVWVSFFYANMNYHASHHLSPNRNFLSLPLESAENYRVGKVATCRLSFLDVLRFAFMPLPVNKTGI
jgi:fatty acid desaturase